MGEDVELAVFHKVAEVFDRQVHSTDLSVEGAVPCFSWLKLVGDWASFIQMCCWRTAPTAVSEASAMMLVRSCVWLWV